MSSMVRPRMRPRGWRVVDLRLALKPVPADAPLMANPAEKPGGQFEDDLQLQDLEWSG